MDGPVLQARREELAETVQSLARMVEQMTTEQEQLRAERDTLADCVRSLQELQQQPPQPKDIQPQVSGVAGGVKRGHSIRLSESGRTAEQIDMLQLHPIALLHFQL
jgi:hypothetical protein